MSPMDRSLFTTDNGTPFFSGVPFSPPTCPSDDVILAVASFAASVALAYHLAKDASWASDAIRSFSFADCCTCAIAEEEDKGSRAGSVCSDTVASNSPVEARGASCLASDSGCWGGLPGRVSRSLPVVAKIKIAVASAAVAATKNRVKGPSPLPSSGPLVGSSCSSLLCWLSVTRCKPLVAADMPGTLASSSLRICSSAGSTRSPAPLASRGTTCSSTFLAGGSTTPALSSMSTLCSSLTSTVFGVAFSEWRELRLAGGGEESTNFETSLASAVPGDGEGFTAPLTSPLFSSCCLQQLSDLCEEHSTPRPARRFDA
mmetsp:Transcript_14463/g.34152  ORF Transcript_14463/g.34152 Transcript_14463/m.34152 type:complete len:316 (-) Transcript_14463:342-1289(-)